MMHCARQDLPSWAGEDNEETKTKHLATLLSSLWPTSNIPTFPNSLVLKRQQRITWFHAGFDWIDYFPACKGFWHWRQFHTQSRPLIQSQNAPGAGRVWAIAGSGDSDRVSIHGRWLRLRLNAGCYKAADKSELRRESPQLHKALLPRTRKQPKLNHNYCTNFPASGIENTPQCKYW